MLRIGKMIELRSFPSKQGFLASAYNKDDIAIVVSYSGETEEVVEAAHFLKDKNVPIIGIISVGENRLSLLCTIFLILVQEKRYLLRLHHFHQEHLYLFY